MDVVLGENQFQDTFEIGLRQLPSMNIPRVQKSMGGPFNLSIVRYCAGDVEFS